MLIIFKQGAIFWHDFGRAGIPGIIQGKRPCIIVSNDVFNTTSGVVNVVPLSTQLHESPVHTQVLGESGKSYGYSLCEQVVTVSKKDLFSFSETTAVPILKQVMTQLRFQFADNI